MTMGLGIYKQALLLLTNASEDVITKSKATELFLHYKTREAVGNLCTAVKQQTLGVCPKLSVIWRFYCNYIQSPITDRHPRYFVTSCQHMEGPGRPAFTIEKEQIEFLQDLHFTWSSIARLLGVSMSTLWRR